MTEMKTKPATTRTPVQTHLACLDWAKNRRLVITLQEYSGRETLNLRIWNRHRQRGCWYPTKRGMIVGMENVDLLGEALLNIAYSDLAEPKPEWLVEHEAEEAAKRD